MINRGFTFKLDPTTEQEALFRQFSGVCRLIYNLALEQRRNWWRHYERETGSRLNYVAQARQLTELRAEFDWIAAVSQTCEQQALKDLDKAFVNFFAGRAAYPTPRRRGLNDSFRFQGRECETVKLNAKWSAVRLPKIGFVKFRDTRPLRGKVNNVTVSSGALGWQVSFSCEIEHETIPSTLPAIGIDRGVANTLALSNGEMFSVPESLVAIDKRKRRAQKALTRKKRGSKRRAKALRRVASLSAKIARIRNDWQHRVSLDIAERFGTVVLEDLRIKNMTASARGTVAEPGRNVRQKAGLNRAILNQAWGGYEIKQAYKLEERGGILAKVPAPNTSRTCPECGCVDARNRKSQAVFLCIQCGHAKHADHNAAIVILRRNTSVMRMEEGHRLSDEVRTRKAITRSENPRLSRRGRC
jgi:putative transposase